MTIDQIRQFASDPLAFLRALVIPAAHGPCRFGDCMADFQVQRFSSIYGALLAVARGNKPLIGRHWWEATKGASKDSDLACCLLWLMAFSNLPLTCQVGAADADQADEMRKAAKDILRLNPWLAERITIQNWRIVCEATGATCDILAADVAGSHGARPDVLIINELSHITKQEFGENLRDNAAKVPQGLVVIATNAGTLGTWQFKWRELARTSQRWHFEQYAQPSSWLDPAEIAEAQQRNSTARFMRLWWGVWSSGSGDALDPADIEAAILRSARPEHWPHPGPLTKPEPHSGYVAGLDLGVKHDHSALVVLGRNSRTQRIRLATCQSWKPAADGKVDLMQVEEAVYESWRAFRFSVCGYDPSQAQLMAQRLQRRGVPMKEIAFQGKNLDKMATTLLEAFRNRSVDLYDDRLLVRDLSRLTIVEKSFGHKLEAVADADGHADRGISFAIALPLAIDLPAHSGLTWGGVIHQFADGQPIRSAGSAERPLTKSSMQFGGHSPQFSPKVNP